jgi:hypothetical protein
MSRKKRRPPQDDVVHMHETVLRPERLMGTTYKLKTPEHVSEHSLFITINDIILNEGTVHETRRPFEIFINSKSLEHYQWIVALTRIISAVFRKGGDVTFLVEELRSVFDPKGGYWNKGKYVPSLIAEIGNVIETHLTEIGMLKAPAHPIDVRILGADAVVQPLDVGAYLIQQLRLGCPAGGVVDNRFGVYYHL